MRKHTLSVIAICLLAFISKTNAQTSSTATLDVASWNIEWFGSTSNGPSDLNLQEFNVKKVLRLLDADVYGICEVVDTLRFRRLVDSLGSNYAYKISDFCSNATTGSGGAWLSGQKLAFIYNKNYVTNATFRGFMRTSSTASSNWATGRFPYLMNADVTINSVTKNINFFVIHGKSGSTQSDYDRRKAGAQEMKDSLDAEYPNKINIIIGDYNDDLYQTICSGCGTTITSYDAIVKDSTKYKSLTLPLSKAGQASEIGYPSVIDNHIVSIAGYTYYVANSAKIRTDATATIANYANNNTSDHYPVTTNYNFSVATAINNISPEDAAIKLLYSATNQPQLYFGKTLLQVQINVVDVMGRTIHLINQKQVLQGEKINIDLMNNASNIYFIQVQTPNFKTVLKTLKQ